MHQSTAADGTVHAMVGDMRVKAHEPTQSMSSSSWSSPMSAYAE